MVGLLAHHGEAAELFIYCHRFCSDGHQSNPDSAITLAMLGNLSTLAFVSLKSEIITKVRKAGTWDPLAECLHLYLDKCLLEQQNTEKL